LGSEWVYIQIIANQSKQIQLLGIMAKKLGLHKRSQVNTARKRVLSLLTLAKQIIQHDFPDILYEDYKKGLLQLINSHEELYLC
jgi:hypothetical protein